LPGDETSARFEQTVLPHLDAAYNLSRWLTRNDHDAEDVTQEACLRALRFIGTQRGENNRAWLLAIVRNTCCTWLAKNRPQEMSGSLSLEPGVEAAGSDLTPDVLAIRNADQQLVREAIEELPLEYREAIVLRELEGLSYKEIATITEVALGTVMSRLSRGRQRLEQSLTKTLHKGVERAL
jgi:RNA polymerase sigma-70 factor (ECF subfamily)